MSHHHTEEPTNKKTNYPLRIALGFVYVLALAFFLHLIIGTQKCEHCSTCSTCNQCSETAMMKVQDATLWGEKESGECCKSKDHCTKEHECKEAKTEREKTESATVEKAEEHKK